MPVKFKISSRAIAVKINDTFESTREAISTVILNDCNKYCKEDTGLLIISSYIHSRLKEGLLIWQTPYAARQYYEIPTAYKDVNNNASWHWVEVARKLHRQDWTRQEQEFVRLYKK